jgi:hypothetical protein
MSISHGLKVTYFAEKIVMGKYLMCLPKLYNLREKSEETTLFCIQLSQRILYLEINWVRVVKKQ